MESITQPGAQAHQDYGFYFYLRDILISLNVITQAEAQAQLLVGNIQKVSITLAN